MLYIGVDLGGTGIKAGVVNERGEILSKGSTPTMKERPYQEIIHDIAMLCKDVAQQAGITMDDVAAIGVGVPGICDAKTGIIPFCTNLGWREVPFVSEMRKYFNLPIIVDNDATVAGYAESVAGVSKGTDSSVFITLGTGVGGGIMGVVPGVMGVAAFAPPLDGAGNSVKAQKALAFIAGHLNLNVFGTTRCVMAGKEPVKA